MGRFGASACIWDQSVGISPHVLKRKDAIHYVRPDQGINTQKICILHNLIDTALEEMQGVSCAKGSLARLFCGVANAQDHWVLPVVRTVRTTEAHNLPRSEKYSRSLGATEWRKMG